MKTKLLILMAFCVMAALQAQPAAADLPDGLVAYWNFNADVNATFGGPAFDGTPVNGASIETTGGRFGGAAYFDEDHSQYITINSPVIDQNLDHTYSAWYRLDLPDGDIIPSARYFVLESTGSGDAYAVSYGLYDYGSGDYGQVYSLSNTSGFNTSFAGATGTQWHHILVTYDRDATGQEHTIYLDGASIGTMASSSILTPTTGLRIGTYRSANGRFFDGWIDDVAFWNRVLTPEEIAEVQTQAITPGFEDIAAGLEGVTESSVAWGDYDNDGDLDILLTGYSFSSGRISRVYRNDGGSFDHIAAELEGVSGFGTGGVPSVAWGDYDNDGDLDILLSGTSSPHVYISRVYRNDGADPGSPGDWVFTDAEVGLADVYYSSVAWGDYDNDGDLDILLAMYGGLGVRVYRNDGADPGSPGDWIFTEAEVGPANVYVYSGAWGDYDNDGDLDILLMGSTLQVGSTFQLYRNDGADLGSPGDWVFTDAEVGLEGVVASSVAWGDYDNDGDLDILMTGVTQGEYVSRVYRNDGQEFGSPDDWVFTDAEVGLEAVIRGSGAWGDYDNDGDLDILLAGQLLDESTISRVYRNDGGSFDVIAAELVGGVYPRFAWGDYDNDGDLDIVLTGQIPGEYVSRVYRNNFSDAANVAPRAPTNLTAQRTGTTLALSWDAATDAETPAAGLTYNLRLGTTPGGSEICSAHADPATGLRLVPQLGNAQQRTTWELEVPGGEYVYWSVQTLDACFAGSAFAAEQMYDGVTGVTEQPLPRAFALGGNYPNPFNPATTIAYDLPRPESVRLRIFDVAGRLVRVLVDGRVVPAGSYQVNWNGCDDRGRTVSAGVYLYRLEAGTFRETRRMMLVK